VSEPRTDVPSAQDEVVEICRDLIRIDSTNYGDGSGPGERAVAEYVAEKLTEVGLEPRLFESHEMFAQEQAWHQWAAVQRPELKSHFHRWTKFRFGGASLSFYVHIPLRRKRV
jgi:acetylornithine deacetylase/succinyl-diaminopimelate desuccinylase-like protein